MSVSFKSGVLIRSPSLEEKTLKAEVVAISNVCLKSSFVMLSCVWGSVSVNQGYLYMYQYETSIELKSQALVRVQMKCDYAGMLFKPVASPYRPICAIVCRKPVG